MQVRLLRRLSRDDITNHFIWYRNIIFIGVRISFVERGTIKATDYLSVVSIVGFWLAQFIAMLSQIKFLPVGALQYGFDVIGSLSLLFLAFVLSNNPSQDEKKRRGNR